MRPPLHAEGAPTAAIGYRDAGALIHRRPHPGHEPSYAINTSCPYSSRDWQSSAEPNVRSAQLPRPARGHWGVALVSSTPARLGGGRPQTDDDAASARWIADLALCKHRRSVAWLDDDAELAPRTTEAYPKSPLSAATTRRDGGSRPRDADPRLARRHRRATPPAVDPRGHAIADATDAALLQALAIAGREEAERWGAMRAHVSWRWGAGGRSAPYASDADVIALHEPVGGASDSEGCGAPLRSLIGSKRNSSVGDQPARHRRRP